MEFEEESAGVQQRTAQHVITLIIDRHKTPTDCLKELADQGIRDDARVSCLSRTPGSWSTMRKTPVNQWQGCSSRKILPFLN
jgi:hypothetical protein